MTAVIATREAIEEQPEAIQIFLAEYQMSVEFIQQNVDEAAELAVAHDIIPNPNIARAAIPRANIVFITGAQMQRYLEGMLNIFYEQLPQSVGGQMPDADFYFIY
jgi:NitT/TauT family transport system substrate-binding protein